MGCLGAHVETEDATGVKSPPARDERKLPKFIPEELQEEFFENRRSVWAGRKDKTRELVHAGQNDGGRG
jgi:hypothetical protein